MSEIGLHKIPIMVAAFNELKEMHHLYEPPQGGQYCSWCGTPFPCVNYKIAQKGLSENG